MGILAMEDYKMPPTIKQIAEEIASSNGISYDIVIDMFCNIMEHINDGTQPGKNDLETFSKKWSITIQMTGIILTECMAYGKIGAQLK